MNRAFGSGPHIPVSADGKQRMVTIMLFGDARGVEFAEQLINEAVENRDQKQKQRHKVDKKICNIGEHFISCLLVVLISFWR